MTSIKPPEVKLNIRGLKEFAGAVKGNTEVQSKVLMLWESRYKAYVFLRFSKYSRGGGDWPPLAQITIDRRRKGNGKGSAAILVNTGTLRAALEPGLRPGWESRRSGWNVVVGFGGPAAHKGSPATIADIASFHNAGSGHLPKRQIIVAPPAEVVAGMRADAARLLNKYGKDKTSAS